LITTTLLLQNKEPTQDKALHNPWSLLLSYFLVLDEPI
jgi:hypothetical protein